MSPTIRKISEGFTLILRSSSEVPMLGTNTNNSHSEHDLFIRLFLTSGGGW
jgi:hypothetical protein